MKLEGRTLQILKNFSTINPSLQFKQGSFITTISPLKTVMAKAAIKEHIPHTFAIYELSRFLGVLSLFESPNITLEDKYLVINSEGKQVQYTYADPKLIVVPGDKEIKLPESEISFTLESQVLQQVLKAMGVLGLPEIAVTGENGIIHIQALDSKNPSSDTYSVKIESPIYNVDAQAKFKMIFLAENIKILPETYRMSISSRGLAHLQGNDIEYWITTESSSSYHKG